MSRLTLATIAHHTFIAGALGPHSVVLDLGAATAPFATAVTEMKGCRCHAVEASSAVAALIPSSHLLAAHHLALAGTDGRATLSLLGSGVASGRLGVPAGGACPAAEEVETVTLDTLMARLGLDCADLVKVDVEGAEIAMFDAASDDTLSRVDQFTVEFHDFMDPTLGPGVLRVKSRLERLGFAAVVFTRRFHGDVLFAHRDRLRLSAIDVAALRAAKYWRGARRMLARRTCPG